MVEPITLGVIAAALIAKALDRAEDDAVDRGVGVVRRGLTALRERFSRENDQEVQQALAQLAEASDSPNLMNSLGELLDERAKRSPELRAELEALVKDAENAGWDVGSITQIAIGDGNVQIADVNTSQINVGQGSVRRDRD
jgi:hypothetical protein